MIVLKPATFALLVWIGMCLVAITATAFVVSFLAYGGVGFDPYTYRDTMLNQVGQLARLSLIAVPALVAIAFFASRPGTTIWLRALLLLALSIVIALAAYYISARNIIVFVGVLVATLVSGLILPRICFK